VFGDAVEKPARYIVTIAHTPHTVGCMITVLPALVSAFSFRVRSHASLELELIATTPVVA